MGVRSLRFNIVIDICYLKSAVDEVTDYTEELATNVKFQTSLNLPDCSSSLFLLGTIPMSTNSSGSSLGSRIAQYYRENNELKT